MPFKLDVYKKTGAKLTATLATIPPNETSLDLRENGLFRLEATELAGFLAAIPPHITSLNLSWNGLVDKSESELIQIFKAIPKHVTSLDLTGNYLYRKPSLELMRIFKAIPESVTRLNMSENEPYAKSEDELIQIIEATPVDVIFLELRRNSLADKESTQLADALARTTENVRIVDLTQNYLAKKPLSDLIQILSAFPDNVTLINLCDPEFPNDRCSDEMIRALRNAPALKRFSLAFSKKEFSKLIKNTPYNAPELDDEEFLDPLATINFDDHLKLINRKSDKYKGSEKYKDAFEAAFQLHLALTDAKSAFLDSKEPMDIKWAELQRSGQGAIDKHQGVLNQHRGWKPYLANLASFIVSLCSFGIANAISNRGMFGLFPTQTDSGKILDNLSKALKTEIKP